ncbi:MAG TPA: fimbria/pilus outer membrane usher protein, partial [Burkholderiaceae bacterium]
MPLKTVPGLAADYDAQLQRMALMVPVNGLDRSVTLIKSPEPDMPRVDPAAQLAGLALNYDLYGQRSSGVGNTSSLSGWSELRLLGVGSGVWSNTMVSRAASGIGAESQRGTVRLDTQWQRNFQDSMVSLTVGDTDTGAVSWSRATRIGGIRLARNFSLQPYRITAPLASMQGEAVLPSTVDLYINGMRQSSQQVQPGQFMLEGIPSFNGLGQAQMVITDINGQRRTVSVPLYGSVQLLQTGLADWSLDLGKVRRDYGLRSSSYSGQTMASATGRYGWSDQVTLEAHSEANADVRQLGAGGAWLLGNRAGVMNAALAASQSEGQTGYQENWGYQWSSSVFSVGLNSLRRDSNYRDVASMYGATLARGSDQAFVGANTPWGSWGAGLVRQQYADGSQARYANLSWSRQLPLNANLNVSAIRSLDGARSTSLYVSLSMPLDRYLSLSSSLRHSPGQQSAVVGATRAIPSDEGGWGWRAETGLGDSRSAQAQVSQLGSYGQWTAGMSY